ncbi:MAG: CARDB domain-containing protein, partial [Nitrospirota bacterium]
MWLLSKRSDFGIWAFDLPPDPAQVEFSPESFSPTHVRNTLEAVIALQSLGADPVEVSSALDWLDTPFIGTSGQLARKAYILRQAGGNPSQVIPVIESARNLDGGVGDLSGYPSSIGETAPALFALSAIGSANPGVTSGMVAYLLASQNSDGGWGFVPGQASRTYYTAFALRALQTQPNMASEAISRATAYLVSRQQPNGTWGSVADTALVFPALVLTNANLSVKQGALAYLLSQQQPDGSWSQDVYTTALALQGLAAVKANPVISTSDVSFSPSTPQDGQAVTIDVTLHNSGLQDAANVAVRFFLGDPAAGGVQIGADQVIASIPSGGSVSASISHSFTGTGGRTIFVQIDPANAIAETSETDNLASSRLWVATPADLAVFTADLVPSTFTPEPGVAFALEYTVRNLGEADPGSSTVAVYDGDPGAGGVLLTTQDLSGVSGAGSRTSTVGITLTSAVAHTLYIVADSTNQTTEQSETNNQASVTVQVGATPMAADLAVTPMDLTLNPPRPQSGESVQVTARFRNEGTEPASNVTVELFDGAPESGGTLLASDTRTLAPGEEQTLVAPWIATAGIHDLYVVLDRANQLVEITETNNQAVLRVMPDLVDLLVSATDLAFTPSHPVIGDSVTFTATVRNLGIRETGAFNVALYDGDPAAGGSLLQTYSVPTLLGDATTTITDTFTAEARTYRFSVVADADGQVTELDEGNNQAMRSLRIKAPGEILGPDLIPLKIDVNGAITNGQTLAISGSVQVTVQNRGDAKITTPTSVLIFDDTNFDSRYTAGVDTVLGTADATQTLWPEGATLVTVPLAGAIRFLHAPLHVVVDANDALAETDETNNSIRSGADCEVRPSQPIQPVVEWRRSDYSGYVLSSSVLLPPAIVNLTDDNGDGQIDHGDIPDVVFSRQHPSSTIALGPSNIARGILRAVRGDTGATIFTVDSPDDPIDTNALAFLAAGDLDQDGLPEIVVGQNSAGLLVYEHDGTRKWNNVAAVIPWNLAHPLNRVTISAGVKPVIADLDADGQAEIVAASTVINADGSIRCAPLQGFGSGTSNGIRQSPIVADLDLDGIQEIVAGNTAYRSDCTVMWNVSSVTDGFTAVGNFDGDIYPETALVTSTSQSGQIPSTRLYLLEHDGVVKWGPVYINQLEGTTIRPPGGYPIIADFDGDGSPEIGVRGLRMYFVIDGNGQVQHTYALPQTLAAGITPDDGQTVAPAVFDLDGDGRPEVLFNTDKRFRIFDGASGTLLHEEPFGAGRSLGPVQTVVVADVDGDEQAEAVVVGYAVDGTFDGLRVYGSGASPWVNARRVWNQPTYHITDVNDDGTIPQYEAPSWLVHNTYRVQAPVGDPANPYLAANLTASYLRAVQTGSGVTLTVRIGNGGAVAAEAGSPVAWYDGDPAAGGVLIGTGQTTRALAPGDYQDQAFTWTGASVGLRTIVAVVDQDGTRPDCDTADNRASLTTTVVPILPDLSVAGSDVQVIGSLSEGRLIPVRVTVHNTGGAEAPSAAVRVTLGDPVQGGIELGRAILPAVAAGASTMVEVLWDSLGATGTNYLYAQVDPEHLVSETTTANNTALTVVELTAPAQPDLSITQVSVSSATPLEGQSITVTAWVSNRGADVGGADVALYLGDPATGGVSLGSQTIPTILAHGQSTTVTWIVETLGRSGSHELVALADPGGAIPEIEETNNHGRVNITVLPSGLAAVVGTAQSAYSANEAVAVSVTLYNSGPARTVDLEVVAEDAAGVLVQTVANQAGLALGDHETRVLSGLTFNTGATFAGNYRIRVRAREAGSVVAEAASSLTIVPVVQAEARLAADKQAYSSHETVTLTTTVTSQSPNHVLTNVTAILTVTDPSSAVVFTETRSLIDVLPGARIELKSFWDTGVQDAGLYTASVSVQGGDGLSAVSQTAFEILSSAAQAAALAGTIEVTPRTIVETEHATIAYTVQNIGNEIDLPLIQVEVLVVDPDTELPVRTLPGEASLNGREVYATTIGFDSVGLTAKPYLFVLRGTTAGVTQALGSTGLTIEPSPNTAPVANAGPDQAGYAGQSIALDGTASSDPNGDPLTFVWRVVSVPAGSQVTDVALAN